MKYYQQLTIIVPAEISSYFIWSKVYTQLHLALVEYIHSSGQHNIGVSFPGYQLNAKKEPGKIPLGDQLRIFAHDEAQLHQLNIGHWLDRLADYVHCPSIRAVPAKTGYAVFSRHQPVTHSEIYRLARRRVQRDPEISLKTALQSYPKKIDPCTLPFIQLNSLSQEQRFRLFISKQTTDAPQSGTFSSYGLSSHATVPDFP
ncbi:type I-F CRISPR-associated endoribonuclease Cas6/Csy4 [Neisseriaceae bacterium ESL0693]|nr:type I-F CRISPR-associated endoribonuclease Cas6/Csy4 [Neisseriaceae bacterium ESL0693]